ncbi:MAG: hypothetical protein ACOCTI_07865 [Phycisphaeraceae bacterium]
MVCRIIPILTCLLAAPLAADEPAAEADAREPWPGIHLDREAGHVEIDATVTLREGDWLSDPPARHAGAHPDQAPA